MNEHTEKQLIEFMSILKALKLSETEILGICSMLKTEDMLFEMLDKMEEKDFKLTRQQTGNMCGGVIKAHLSTKNTLRGE